MEKQGPEAVDLFIQTHGEGTVRWENNGRREVAKVKGVNIFYALNERNLTSQGEAKVKLQVIEESNVLKMTTGCKQRGFTEEEISTRRHRIKQEMQKERYDESEDWETAETSAATNPHLEINQPTSSGE